MGNVDNAQSHVNVESLETEAVRPLFKHGLQTAGTTGSTHDCKLFDPPLPRGGNVAAGIWRPK